MADDEDDKPPSLRVVSDNPNARTDRHISWTKQEAQRAIARFAASLLRTMAGSDSEANYLFDHLSRFVDALKQVNDLSGRGLTIGELREALRLPEVSLDESDSDSDYRYRHWLREHGMEVIVQGALRLAAHKLLGERPHFGGKYSERVIEDGIKTLEELKRPPRIQPQLRNKNLAANWDDIDLDPPLLHGRSPRSEPKVAAEVSGRATRKRQAFGQEDLRELRKAIKAKDQKRINELTSKIRKSSLDD